MSFPQTNRTNTPNDSTPQTMNESAPFAPVDWIDEILDDDDDGLDYEDMLYLTQEDEQISKD